MYKKVGIYNASSLNNDGIITNIIKEIEDSEFELVIYMNQFECESYHFTKETLSQLKNILIKKNIKFYFICGAEFQNVHIEHLNLFTTDVTKEDEFLFFLPWSTFLLHYSYYFLKHKVPDFENLIFEKKFNHLFLCYNNKSRYHRCYLIDNLEKNNLLNIGLVSWRMKEQYLSDNYEFKYWKEKPLSVDNPIIQPENSPDSFDEYTKDMLNMETFLTVVTESSDKFIFHTEKTYRTILLEQPFLSFGAKNQNTTLRQYGFELYDEIFNYSLDGSETIDERTQGIVNNINTIKDKNLYELYELIKDKVMYNKKNAMKIIDNDPYIPNVLVESYKKYNEDFMTAINKGILPNWVPLIMKNK